MRSKSSNESDDEELSMIDEQRIRKEDKTFEYNKSKTLKKKNNCRGKKDRNQSISPSWLWKNDVVGRYEKKAENKAEALTKFYDYNVIKLQPTIKKGVKSYLGFNYYY